MILGASIANDAGDNALKEAYQVFKHEARCLKPSYAPDTVNIDGWNATRKAWTCLFTSIVIVYCFLHVFIKIRDRAKKKYKDIFIQATSKLWDCFHAENKLFMSRFKGRDDVYARRWENKKKGSAIHLPV